MSVTVAPHGVWKSPITGNSFTARSVTLSQVRVDGPDTYWVEGHPREGGRGTLLRRRSTGETGEVLPLIDGVRLPDIGTRVHEYGGKAYAVHHGVIVFSDRTDGRVYAFDTAEPRRGIRPLTTLSQVRYGDFWIADVRGLVYAVAEDHSGEGEPVNSIVAIPLDGSAARNNDAIIPVFGGTDFAQAPTVSPDGTKLAWISWNHPNMPWTYSQLRVASLTFEGTIDQEVVLVDQPGVCVYEPRWTFDGELIHVDDASGWANVEGRRRPERVDVASAYPRPTPGQARVLTPTLASRPALLRQLRQRLPGVLVGRGPGVAHRYRTHRQRYDRGMGDRLVAHR